VDDFKAGKKSLEIVENESLKMIDKIIGEELLVSDKSKEEI
jgi:hypothetical protein